VVPAFPLKEERESRKLTQVQVIQQWKDIHSSPYSIVNVDMLRGGANETHVAHLAVLESFGLPLAKMLWCLLLLLRFEMGMMIRNAFSQQVRKALWNSHLSFCLL
jgi:hypothetical protein